MSKRVIGLEIEVPYNKGEVLSSREKRIKEEREPSLFK